MKPVVYLASALAASFAANPAAAQSDPAAPAPPVEGPGIVVTGASGRMGQMLLRLVAENPEVRLVGALERPGHPWIGRDAGECMGGAALGVQPAKAPRYIIELIVDVLERDLGTGTGKPPSFVYRVTAMGFGPRADIQAMTQMMYRD